MLEDGIVVQVDWEIVNVSGATSMIETNERTDGLHDATQRMQLLDTLEVLRLLLHLDQLLDVSRADNHARCPLSPDDRPRELADRVFDFGDVAK